MKLEEIKKLCDAATPGPWRWLGHDIGNTEHGRQWFFVEDDSNETRLTNRSPGDVIFDISNPLGVIARSVSTGYGGETDIEISDQDKAFIAASRTLLPKLLAVAEAAKAFEDAIGAEMPTSYPEFFRAQHNCIRERRNLKKALSALESDA